MLRPEKNLWPLYIEVMIQKSFQYLNNSGHFMPSSMHPTLLTAMMKWGQPELKDQVQMIQFQHGQSAKPLLVCVLLSLSVSHPFSENLPRHMLAGDKFVFDVLGFPSCKHHGRRALFTGVRGGQAAGPVYRTAHPVGPNSPYYPFN